MQKYKSKVNIFLVMLIIMSCLFVNVAHAGIFDDILKTFGITTDNKDTAEQKEEKIDKEVEEFLDSKQKEVVEEIEKIYSYVQNVDIDALTYNIDYKLPEQVTSNVEEFFGEYDKSLNNVKSIMKTLKYKIVDVTNMGDKVVAKIAYTYPSVPKVITKILPELIVKNAGVLFGADINNDTLDSVLESVKNELRKGAYEEESYTREFNFKKINGEWKLVDVGDIVKDAEKYISDISKNLFK